MRSDTEKTIFGDFLERENSSWLRKAPLQTLPAAEKIDSTSLHCQRLIGPKGVDATMQ